MSLPNLPAGDKFRREVRTEWGGLNLNENAGDGELIEAMNMSSREYPVLSTAHLYKERGIHYGNRGYVAPFVYDGKLGFEYDTGTYNISLMDPTRPNDLIAVGNQWSRQYALLGHRMCLFGEPRGLEAQNKQIYDFDSGAMANMEASWTSTMAAPAEFMDGELYGVPATGNTLYAYGANWSAKFKVGDAVTISGSRIAAYDKTAVIREISGDYLRFDENTFDVSGRYYLNGAALQQGSVYLFATDAGDHSFTWSGDSVAAGLLLYNEGDGSVTVWTGAQSLILKSLDNPAQTTGTRLYLNKGYCNIYDTVNVSRTVPDMDFVCVNENRVWGCKGDTIYASKLGDPLNWNVYDGLSTDSWTAETGAPGNFTGCCSFQGYPTFFKENCVFKVLGDEPQNYTLRKINIVGVKYGADATIVEIRGRLYYLSRSGIMQWNGGDYPNVISGALGLEPNQAATLASYGAGTDSEKYYIQLSPVQFVREVGGWVQQLGIYVYDPRFGTWHMLQDEGVGIRAHFTGDGSHNWMLKDYDETGIPNIYPLHTFVGTPDTTTPWYVTFADSTRAYKTALTGSESKKGVLRLLIRCRLAGSMKVWIAYDGGDFEEAGEFGGEDGMDKGSRVVPLILRRCDFWQLRLTGTGDAVIYSIAVERYGGEWQQA